MVAFCTEGIDADSFTAVGIVSLRVGLMLISDEAPEATCLRNVCGSFRRLVRVYSRCMRLSGKAATVLGPRVRPEDDQVLTGRGSGCGITVR